LPKEQENGAARDQLKRGRYKRGTGGEGVPSRSKTDDSRKMRHLVKELREPRRSEKSQKNREREKSKAPSERGSGLCEGRSTSTSLTKKSKKKKKKKKKKKQNKTKKKKKQKTPRRSISNRVTRRVLRGVLWFRIEGEKGEEKRGSRKEAFNPDTGERIGGSP